MAQVNMHEAKTTLSQLVERAEAGEEVVIARNGTPAVRLVPVAKPMTRAESRGMFRGQIHMTEDFDSSDGLDDEFLDAFGLR